MARPTVEYPVRDEEPMGETDQHRDELYKYALEVLLEHFKGRAGIYVSGNNFVYYTKGDPKAVVSPDTYVVKGVAQAQRDTYMLWEHEGRAPCFVLEITSKSTRQQDLGEKMSRYRDDLEVPEYFLFDPRGEWIPELLRGFRLEQGVYQPIAPNEDGRLPSQELGLELATLEGHVRYYLPDSGEPLPTTTERAEAAEAELARLREENARLKSESP